MIYCISFELESHEEQDGACSIVIGETMLKLWPIFYISSFKKEKEQCLKFLRDSLLLSHTFEEWVHFQWNLVVSKMVVVKSL